MREREREREGERDEMFGAQVRAELAARRSFERREMEVLLRERGERERVRERGEREKGE